jgi:hypothetical protein
METWNREQLYSEIWEEPASKVAVKYGISDVMLGKYADTYRIQSQAEGIGPEKLPARS